MTNSKELYPMLKVTGDKKYETEIIFQTIDACMREMEGLRDVYEILDYGISNFHNQMLRPDVEYQIHTQVNIGGSEGIYTDIWLTDETGNRVVIGTYKTLEDDVNASILMGKISGAYAFLFEIYYMANL